MLYARSRPLLGDRWFYSMKTVLSPAKNEMHISQKKRCKRKLPCMTRSIRGYPHIAAAALRTRIAHIAFDLSSPQSAISTFIVQRPLRVPTASTLFTTSTPAVTRPKTTCAPFRCGVWVTVRKN